MLSASRRSESDVAVLYRGRSFGIPHFGLSALWGGGFLAAFFTMNLPLFPGLGGEYQPILFVLLVLLALIVTGNIRREVALPVFGLALSLLGVSLWHAIQQSLNVIDLIRCSVGLLFVLGAPALIAQVPLGAFRLIVWVHVLFAIFGLIYPEGAAGVVTALGLRGALYYGGWNAFFASEPSYAALNLAAVIAIATLKASMEETREKRDWVPLMGAIVILLTQSVTGLMIAAILIWAWAGAKIKFSFFRFVLIASFGFVLLLTALQWEYVDAVMDSRIGNALEAGAAVFKEGSLLPFFLLEPSGAWRLLSNLTGLSVAFHYFLGIGSLALQNVVTETAPTAIANFILSSELYDLLGGEFNAQIPLANYAVFGGLLPSVGLLLLSSFAMRRAVRFNTTTGSRLFVVIYILIGLLWQGALTAPGWWLLMGYALAMGKKSPKRPNSQTTLKGG